jgi:chromosome segregation ATPase
MLKAKNAELSNANMDVAGKVAKYKESDFKNLTQANALQKDVEVWKAKYDEAKLQVTELTKRVAGSDAVYKNQLDDYNVKISELTALKRQLDADRAELQQEREAQLNARLTAMKQTWIAHETAVEEAVRGICSKYQLEYFGKEQVPFKGKPDNTIMICDEYVIFDAKSPQTDNLSNFPDYVKSQAEAAKKYAKEDEVRKDIYLVVPSNTLEALPEYYAQAVRENDVDVIAPPEIDITAGREEGPVTFDAVVEVRPRVSVAGYGGLRVEIPRPRPSDEEIDAQVERMRNQFAELEAVDRPAIDTDQVTVDIVGSRDGEALPGLDATDYLYEVGSAAIVPELDDHLRGAKPGDILQFSARHPDPE